MNSTHRNLLVLLNTLLLLPALILCGSGILYLAFGLESANEFLESLLKHGWGQVFLSPLVVLGGPCLSFAINVGRVCRIRFAAEDRAVIVSLCVERTLSQIAFALLSMGLGTLLLFYLFVENFQIVPRL